MPLRHLVLFRIRDEVADADVDRALAGLRGLGDLPGIVSWRVEMSTDTRKGRVIVEDSTFVDRAALQDFRAHPRHAESSALLARIADWLVGDYDEEPAVR